MKILLLNMQNTQHITETQAIKIAKSMLKQGFTISYLNVTKLKILFGAICTNTDCSIANLFFTLTNLTTNPLQLFTKKNKTTKGA
jgi:hypothetical protein